MEIKKNPKKDLELSKNIFFQAGLVFALFVVFVAFEWKTYDKVAESDLDLAPFFVIEEEIEITRPEEPEPPAPQVPEIVVVEDDEEITDEIEFVEDLGQAIKEVVVQRVDVEVVEVVEPEIFRIVEEQPEFPGGESKMMEFLARNTVYPEIAKQSNIQGVVHVQFVVEPDGSISNVTVLRGIGGGCDEEAIRVVKSFPKWKPGRQRGKPVRVYFNLPFRFVLN